MAEIFRTRDTVVFTKGVTWTVAANTAMVQGGWSGCQGVKWVNAPTDNFMVGYGDGVHGAGFALWGSDEDSDKLTALTGQQGGYGYVVLGAGGWILATRIFERYTYASRQAGPLVAINYAAKDLLYWSLRGLLTKEDEWTAAGDPRAPNTNSIGNVVQAPVNGFLTVQTQI